jgi:hypothetical protein
MRVTNKTDEKTLDSLSFAAALQISFPAPMTFAHHELEVALIALQFYQVLFLWLHDWIPLGRLNNVAAVRAEDSFGRLVCVTIMQSLPFTIGLYFSLRHFGGRYPDWLVIYLWVSYGLIFLGQLRAWWVPYLFKPDPVRAARYEKMFGKTHAFLPFRNGIRPNTAHITLHVATALTLLVLALAKSGD